MELQNVLYLLVSAGLFFVMMRFGCGSHVMGHGHEHGAASPGDGHEAGGGAEGAVPDQATDPVCRMPVQTAKAKTAVYGGTVYYFCSRDCREKFEAAPQSYAKRTAAGSQAQGRHHGC